MDGGRLGEGVENSRGNAQLVCLYGGIVLAAVAAVTSSSTNPIKSPEW